MKVVRLSALRTGRLYLQEIFPVFISLWGWVDPSTTVRLEGLCQRRIPVTPSGIDAATFRLVVQCLNHVRHRVPPNKNCTALQLVQNLQKKKEKIRLRCIYKLISYLTVKSRNAHFEYQLVSAAGATVPWLRRIVAGLTPWRPGFDSALIYLGFVIRKVTLGLAFLWALRLSTVSIIPSRIYTLGSVSSPLGVWKLERVCSQTQLCQLRCFNDHTRQLHVSAPTGHLQVSSSELNVLLYTSIMCAHVMERSLHPGFVAQ